MLLQLSDEIKCLEDKSGKRKMVKKYQCRNWCFTDFELLDWGTIFAKNNKYIRYVGYGLEICPKSGRKHNQGWIQLWSSKTMLGMKRMIKCNKLHLEPCGGDEESNDKYCSKEGDFKRLDVFAKIEKRVDLEIIHASIVIDIYPRFPRA